MERGAAATLSLIGAAASGQTIDVLAGSGLLDLAAPTSSTSFAGNTLTVTSGSTVELKLHFSSLYALYELTAVGDTHGGTLIKFV